MNKVRRSRIGLAFLLSSVLLTILVGISFAAHYKAESFAGDTATALKVNTILTPGISWRAEIYSDMYNNTVINGIGWSSWNVYEKCNSVTTQLIPRSPVSVQAAHQSLVYDQPYDSYCPSGTKRIGHNGNHEYKKQGLETKYLYTLAESIFP